MRSSGMVCRLGTRVLVLALAGCVARAESRPAVVGAAAPDYAAVSLAGDSVSLAGLRGEVVLLNVWATWCPPCREEMPGLERLQRELGAKGLRVVGASIDGAAAEGEVRDFTRGSGVTFTVLLDPEARVTRSFRTTGVPETFLIGRDGTLLKRWIGAIRPESESVRGPILRALGAARVTYGPAMERGGTGREGPGEFCFGTHVHHARARPV